MAYKENSPIIARVMSERGQSYLTRNHLFDEIEKKLQRPLVTYFTSIELPSGVDGRDVDVLEGMLQEIDLSNGLALMVSSLGGDGLAAERIVNVCRSYSKTNEFWAVVLGQAKSAATMICLGASKIIMGPAAELGPVDPQVKVVDNKNQEYWISVFHVVDSYTNLFNGAVNEKNGHIEPYLQQLGNYDAKIVSHYQSLIALSRDMAIKVLGSGMMRGIPDKEIEGKIQSFLTPNLPPKGVWVHGRPIFRDDGRQCGLKIEDLDMRSELGRTMYELHTRSRFFADSQVQKLIEAKDDNVAYVGMPQS